VAAVLVFGGPPAIPGRAAGAGSIRGRVVLQQPPPAIETRPNVSEMGMPAPRNPVSRRRSVVYLETAPRGAFEGREERRAVMDQRNQTFVPHVLAITTGTTVDFPNSDPTYHNVFSLSKTRPFDLGRYAAGRSKAVRFDRPGIVRVFCDIHSHMTAYILVFAHRFFAATDDDGRYELEGVPPGSYVVSVWHETLARQSRSVVIADSGGAVELNFELGPGSPSTQGADQPRP
jgi:plastocyanin